MDATAWRLWTDSEDGRLMQLVDEGRSNREIAADLDRTPGAVAARLNALSRKRNATNGRTPQAEKPPAPPAAGEDPEIVVMATIASRLRELPVEARGRVLAWLYARYANE